MNTTALRKKRARRGAYAKNGGEFRAPFCEIDFIFALAPLLWVITVTAATSTIAIQKKTARYIM